jgi:dipeptidyl-peptidase-3
MLSPCSPRVTFVAFSAAWHGTRIILRQTSPESVGIFDFIMELYAFCSGHWHIFSTMHNVNPGELEAFLEYASTFLSNIGNYYVFLLTYDAQS